MSKPILAEHVADILTRLACNGLDETRKRAADTLQDAVVGRLRRIRRAAVFDLFEADPAAERHRLAFVTVLDEQLTRDPGYRAAISDLARAAGAPLIVAAFPDDDRPFPLPPKRILLGAGAAVLVLVLFFGGRALYTEMTDEPVRDGTTPCRTFWALKEPDQRSLLVRAYEERGQTRRSDDPYFVAAVLYACGQQPEDTVNQILDAAALGR
ncbi:hypothetical protein [Actinokineospora enzanensis]|uniref:hypothetical protein n=1 Tax=Actinokineospora enzanensis TaxID=155975 RepID=UPI0003679347|nr:hypothetical protein [Actinokineospora enzanensis]